MIVSSTVIHMTILRTRRTHGFEYPHKGNPVSSPRLIIESLASLICVRETIKFVPADACCACSVRKEGAHMLATCT